MKYSERFEKYPNTIIISYSMRWGGSFHDHHWIAEMNGEVEDYASKEWLIADAEKRKLPWVVLRVHRNFTATNIACSGQETGAAKSDGESTSAVSCH